MPSEMEKPPLNYRGRLFFNLKIGKFQRTGGRRRALPSAPGHSVHYNHFYAVQKPRPSLMFYKVLALFGTPVFYAVLCKFPRFRSKLADAVFPSEFLTQCHHIAPE